MHRLAGSLGLLLLAACGNSASSTGPSNAPLLAPPTGLAYFVGPVGSGSAPSSILLRWDFDTSSYLAVWNVYSRRDTTAGFFLRAQTTSPTFHDAGVPDVQYLVTAVDVNGNESASSPVVTVDERLQLVAPDSLYTTALNGGVRSTGRTTPMRPTSSTIGCTARRMTSAPSCAAPTGGSRGPRSLPTSSPRSSPTASPAVLP